MDEKLLLKVKERILTEEYPVVMDYWFSVKKRDAVKNWILEDWVRNVIPSTWLAIDPECGMTKLPDKERVAEYGCKTAGCIAGHAIIEKWGGRKIKSLAKSYPEAIKLNNEGDVDNVYFSTLGEIALDLTTEEAGVLFYDYMWPQTFGVEYNQLMKTKQYKKANQVVALRIDWFLLTGG